MLVYRKLLIFFLLGSSAALAQNTVADLQLELVDYPIPTSPGALTGTFSFRLTNLGPEVSGLYSDPNFAVFVMATTVDVLPEGPEVSMRSTDPASCEIFEDIIWDPPPGEPIKVGHVLILPPQAPGAVVFCPLEYEILPGLDYELRIRWEARAIRTDDPDRSNDSFTLIFNAQPRQIPTMTSWGLVAFALTLLGAFAVLRRRL